VQNHTLQSLHPGIDQNQFPIAAEVQSLDEDKNRAEDQI
jgi:hypothetical protein